MFIPNKKNANMNIKSPLYIRNAGSHWISVLDLIAAKKKPGEVGVVSWLNQGLKIKASLASRNIVTKKYIRCIGLCWVLGLLASFNIVFDHLDLYIRSNVFWQDTRTRLLLLLKSSENQVFALKQGLSPEIQAAPPSYLITKPFYSVHCQIFYPT